MAVFCHNCGEPIPRGFVRFIDRHGVCMSCNVNLTVDAMFRLANVTQMAEEAGCSSQKMELEEVLPPVRGRLLEP